MGTPFKMKGFGGFGNSPLKQNAPGRLPFASSLGKTFTDIFPGVGKTGITTKFSGGKQRSTTTFTPGYSFTNRYGDESGSVGLQLTGAGKERQSGKGGAGFTLHGSLPWDKTDTYTGIRAEKKLGGGSGPHGLHTGLSAKIRGTAGFRDLFTPKSWKNPKKGKFTYGVRGEVGIGSRAWNVSAFGEHRGKHHLLGKGTTVGVKAKGGLFRGSVGYNIKTKKPEFTLGVNIGK